MGCSPVSGLPGFCEGVIFQNSTPPFAHGTHAISLLVSRFLAAILPRYAAHVGNNPYWQPGRKKSPWYVIQPRPRVLNRLTFSNHLQALMSELRSGLKVSSNYCYQMPPASRTAYRRNEMEIRGGCIFRRRRKNLYIENAQILG